MRCLAVLSNMITSWFWACCQSTVTLALSCLFLAASKSNKWSLLHCCSPITPDNSRSPQIISPSTLDSDQVSSFQQAMQTYFDHNLLFLSQLAQSVGFRFAYYITAWKWSKQTQFIKPCSTFNNNTNTITSVIFFFFRFVSRMKYRQFYFPGGNMFVKKKKTYWFFFSNAAHLIFQQKSFNTLHLILCAVKSNIQPAVNSDLTCWKCLHHVCLSTLTCVCQSFFFFKTLRLRSLSPAIKSHVGI